MPTKKRRSGKGKGSRQGISGNPQRRAEQLAQRRPAIADEPDLPPLVLDFRPGKQEDSPLRDLAYALAGGAEPRPWWDESHQRILADARALTWPSRLVDLETQVCRIVGDEFYERLNSRVTGLHPRQWLRALAEETGTALRASVADGTGDWRQLWALLCGLALTVPPGDTESETAKLARARFPDIKDPYVIALAEAGKAAKLLADRGLASGIGHPADGCRATGDPLIACDAYGSRFLLVAPFGYDGKRRTTGTHGTSTRAGSSPSREPGCSGRRGTRWLNGSMPSARRRDGTIAERARDDRPAAGTLPGDRAAVDMLQGSEPVELIREYYRLRRRARGLAIWHHGRERHRGLVRRRRPRPRSPEGAAGLRVKSAAAGGCGR